MICTSSLKYSDYKYVLIIVISEAKLNQKLTLKRNLKIHGKRSVMCCYGWSIELLDTSPTHLMLDWSGHLWTIQQLTSASSTTDAKNSLMVTQTPTPPAISSTSWPADAWGHYASDDMYHLIRSQLDTATICDIITELFTASAALTSLLFHLPAKLPPAKSKSFRLRLRLVIVTWLWAGEISFTLAERGIMSAFEAAKKFSQRFHLRYSDSEK